MKLKIAKRNKLPDDEIEIKDSLGIKTGKYSKKHIEFLTKAAKSVGIDPHTLIALSLQESGIGTAVKKASPLYGRHSRSDVSNFIGQVADFTPEQEKELSSLSGSTGIGAEYLKPAIVLRDKLKYAERLGFQDEAMKLQAYNGYGKLLPQKDASGQYMPTRYYGIDVPATGIDMRQNPLYGKRLISLKTDLQKNKAVNEIVNSIVTK